MATPTTVDVDKVERLVLTLRMIVHPMTAVAGLSDNERSLVAEAAAELERLAGLADG